MKIQETQQKLLEALGDEELPTRTIAHRAGIADSTARAYLQDMRKAGLIKSTTYRLRKPGMPSRKEVQHKRIAL